MTLALGVDIEKLVGNYLRTHADVIALATRVVGKTPTKTDTSWVRVTELDSPQVGLPDHLVSFMVQLDAYAGDTGGQPEVKLLSRTVRAVLGTIIGTHAEGVVTGVQVLGGPRNPDTDFEPARERMILTAILWAHVQT